MTRPIQARKKNRTRRTLAARVIRRFVQKPVTIVTEVGGVRVLTSLVDGTSYPAVARYLEAHRLLPYGFDGASAAWEEAVAQAHVTLDDANANVDALLRAIVLLGHTPTQAALRALQCHAQTGRAHADTAIMAAEECEDWIRQSEGARPEAN